MTRFPPQWSPDGTELAVAVGPFVHKGDIVVAKADGSGQRVLTTDQAANPTWSPDGKRIAFHRFVDVSERWHDRPCTMRVWVINADGSGERRLDPLVDGCVLPPIWSPDGTRLLSLLIVDDYSTSASSPRTAMIRRSSSPGPTARRGSRFRPHCPRPPRSRRSRRPPGAGAEPIPQDPGGPPGSWESTVGDGRPDLDGSASAERSYHRAMTAAMPYGRRLFLADLGRAGFAVAILGVAGCATSAGSRRHASTAAASDGGARVAGRGTRRARPPRVRPPARRGIARPAPRLARHLGFVSAYILARNGEARDRGHGRGGQRGRDRGRARPPGSAGATSVTSSSRTSTRTTRAAPPPLERSPDAMAYAGAQDIPAITGRGRSPRSQMATRCSACASWPPRPHPGTSPCSTRRLASRRRRCLRITDGAPTPPGGQFTEDADAAMASIAKLGALRFETLLVGHGEPIESGAAALVKALAGG